MCFFKEEEAEGGNHSDYGGQSHALELYRAYDDGGAGETGDLRKLFGGAADVMDILI